VVEVRDIYHAHLEYEKIAIESRLRRMKNKLKTN
jgi:hypothetical protein